MPLVPTNYRPPLLFRNGHFATIYSGLFRKINGLVQERERLELSDGDFLDLDWSHAPGRTREVALLLHGLEGNAQRPYMTGSAQQFNAHGMDVCAVNFRGCSGEPNRLYRSYHSGATEDLEAVLRHIVSTGSYEAIYIKGFSLGGNLALKYVGEGRKIPEALKAVVAVSVPCDLHDSLVQLLRPKNYPYARRFHRHLVQKLIIKQQIFPQKITDKAIAAIKTLKDFDDIYTSQAHGFADALDYYGQCSCRQFLPAIRVPTLIINAANDSFLGHDCYPYPEARENGHIHLEVPKYGGHVGFYGTAGGYYNESRSIKFIEGI